MLHTSQSAHSYQAREAYSTLDNEIVTDGSAFIIKHDDDGMYHAYPDGTPAYEERYNIAWSFSEGLAKVSDGVEEFYIDTYGFRVFN